MALKSDYIFKGVCLTGAYHRISKVVCFKTYVTAGGIRDTPLNKEMFSLLIDVEISAAKLNSVIDVKSFTATQATPFTGDIFANAYAYLLTLSEYASAASV